MRRKRQLYAYSLLMDKDTAQAKRERADFVKTKKAHPYAGEVRSEEEKIGQISSLEG
jgi:hypothetical protein